MSIQSISQVLQALLPGGHTETAGARGEAPLAGLHPEGTTADRLAGRSAESVGGATGLGQTLLDSLEMTPLQAQLGASLSETLSQSVSAQAIVPVAVPVAVAEVMPEPPPKDGPQTLQQMAQATPRHDIATERHRGPDHEASPAALLSKDMNASAPAPSVRAEPQATPLARDVLITTAVTSLLHTPATTLRTSADAHDPLDDATKRQRQSSNGDADAEPDADDGLEAPPEELTEQEAVVHLTCTPSDQAGDGMVVTPEPAPQDAGLTSDPLLYQQLVAALQSRSAAHPGAQVALDELKRQRRVVIATPVSADSGGLRGAAHVDVLCPSLGGGRAWRFGGELLWSQAAGGPAWFEVHLVKTQAQGHVRQLVPIDAQSDAREVAVCLGAQAMPMTAWSQVCLRVRDGNRLWAALDAQWSLRLLVARAPLSLSVQQAPGGGVFHAA